MGIIAYKVMNDGPGSVLAHSLKYEPPTERSSILNPIKIFRRFRENDSFNLRTQIIDANAKKIIMSKPKGDEGSNAESNADQLGTDERNNDEIRTLSSAL
jgi:hypothetical protein